jgi:hypothetical protein
MSSVRRFLVALGLMIGAPDHDSEAPQKATAERREQSQRGPTTFSLCIRELCLKPIHRQARGNTR